MSDVVTEGPLSVTDMSSQAHPLCNTYLQAARELGSAAGR